jgi:hypothetical protein
MGEDNSLAKTDTKRLKHGERAGLETPVVHALTYEGEMLEEILALKANALSLPPEEYGRKIKTQKN